MYSILETGPQVDINRTSYVDSIKTTYDDLCAVFGEPSIDGGDKTTKEWWIKFIDYDGNTVVATIYDYKYTSTPYELTDWHIGGRNQIFAEGRPAVLAVKDVMKAFTYRRTQYESIRTNNKKYENLLKTMTKDKDNDDF